jgi:hypothetical protein
MLAAPDVEEMWGARIAWFEKRVGLDSNESLMKVLSKSGFGSKAENLDFLIQVLTK